MIELELYKLINFDNFRIGQIFTMYFWEGGGSLHSCYHTFIMSWNKIICQFSDSMEILVVRILTITLETANYTYMYHLLSEYHSVCKSVYKDLIHILFFKIICLERNIIFLQNWHFLCHKDFCTIYVCINILDLRKPFSRICIQKSQKCFPLWYLRVTWKWSAGNRRGCMPGSPSTTYCTSLTMEPMVRSAWYLHAF